VPPTAQRLVSAFHHLVRAPAAAIVRFSDDGDAVWEPFLRDDLAMTLRKAI
jgi:hypothetical protein